MHTIMLLRCFSQRGRIIFAYHLRAIIGRDRLGEIIPWAIKLGLALKTAFVFGFHTFHNRAQAQLFGNCEQGFADGDIAAVIRHTLAEGFIQFNAVHREMF